MKILSVFSLWFAPMLVATAMTTNLPTSIGWTPVGPDDVVFVSGDRTTVLTPTNSGLPGHPIWLIGTNNNRIMSDFFASGAVQLGDNVHDIIITNLNIFATNNGTTLGNRVNSVGISGNAVTNVIVTTCTITNMYAKDMTARLYIITNEPAIAATDTSTVQGTNVLLHNSLDNFYEVVFVGSAPSPLIAGTWYWIVNSSGSSNTFQVASTQFGSPITLTSGGTSYSIAVRQLDDNRYGYPISISGNGILVTNCYLADGDCGLSFNASLSLMSGLTVATNQFHRLNHSMQIGMGNSSCLLTNTLIAGNNFDDWNVWDCPGNTQVHLDGIFIWNNTYDPSSCIDGIEICGNRFGGNVGTRTTSSLAIYLYNSRYQMRNSRIHDNMFKCLPPGSWGGGFATSAGSNTWIYNNTFIGVYTNGTLYGGRIVLGNDVSYCYNNLCLYSSGLQVIAATSNSVDSSSSGTNTENILTNYFTKIWSDYNVYYDGGNDLPQFGCEYDQSPVTTGWISGNMTGLHNWQTWIGNNRGMTVPIWNTAHADPHSTTNAVIFKAGSDYMPDVVDVTANGAGTNLLAALTAAGFSGPFMDMNGIVRPSSGRWTIGSQEVNTNSPPPPEGTNYVRFLIRIR